MQKMQPATIWNDRPLKLENVEKLQTYKMCNQYGMCGAALWCTVRDSVAPT